MTTIHEKLVVITGAGISVESGIKPFRGDNGLWNENPMEMATFHKFKTEPALFLSWYFKRFVSCKDALPNATHDLLAKHQVKVITQNVDNLHRKAAHPAELLIEIHGNINYKRKINATSLSELIPADWDKVNEDKLVEELFKLFQINSAGVIHPEKSFRPHILLFDEYYTDLYESEIALDWVDQSETIIFMGTSNSVGITAMVLEAAFRKGKKIMVVDPKPDISFRLPGIDIFQESASSFCERYFGR